MENYANRAAGTSIWKTPYLTTRWSNCLSNYSLHEYLWKCTKALRERGVPLVSNLRAEDNYLFNSARNYNPAIRYASR